MISEIKCFFYRLLYILMLLNKIICLENIIKILADVELMVQQIKIHV